MLRPDFLVTRLIEGRSTDTHIRALAMVLGIVMIAGSFQVSGAESEPGLSCRMDFEPAGGDYQFLQRRLRQFSMPAEARIGEVHITRLPIFNEQNPDEDNALFRWANSFHFLTREETIQQVLLFEPGSTIESRLIEESARLLRRQGYFYDADIRPVSLCGNELDVEVITRDNWSLTPNIAFDRLGGDNTFSMGLRDTNLMGYGKEIGVSYEDGIDRVSKSLFYRDDNVFGTRVRNVTAVSDTNEGESVRFDLDLPFYSLDTTRSWGIGGAHETRRDEQYFRGEEVSEVQHRINDFHLKLGRSAGLVNDFAKRWTVGYRYRSNEFSPTSSLPPPQQFPEDKTLSYPYVRFESIQDEYVTTYNLDQIGRTEDLQTGRSWFLSLGYAAEILGSDADRFVLEGEFQDTLIYNSDILWQHGLELSSLWNRQSGQSEDVILSYENRYFRRQTSHNSFLAQFRAIYSRNLNSHQQIVLGGYTGVRGFENQFQVGDRSLVLNLEERVYTDVHVFNLIRLGGAVFVDVGRAWEPGEFNGTEEDLLANVGFGLRLASSKAASNRIAHLDFAFPITNKDDPKVDSLMISFTVKGSF